jgi:uncharacterized protein YecE (DUF72 family)
LVSAIAQNNGYIGLNAMAIKKSFYSGTSGLVLPVPQRLYPEAFQNKSRLEYYASLFNSVEINSSFYKNPKLSTVQKWAQVVPDDFRFSFKLSKNISHAKGLLFNNEDVDAFMQVIDAVGKKKGCLLVQFPASTRIERFSELQNLLTALQPVTNGWQIAIEFRHPSWYNNEVYKMLEQLNTTIVIHDIPASATPEIEMKATFRYLRFHGENGRYRGSYADDVLEKYAINIRQRINEGQTAYVYFNNTMGGAVNNLQTLNRLVNLD